MEGSSTSSRKGSSKEPHLCLPWKWLQFQVQIITQALLCSGTNKDWYWATAIEDNLRLSKVYRTRVRNFKQEIVQKDLNIKVFNSISSWIVCLRSSLKKTVNNIVKAVKVVNIKDSKTKIKCHLLKNNLLSSLTKMLWKNKINPSLMLAILVLIWMIWWRSINFKGKRS